LTPDAVAIPLRLRHVPKTKSRKKDDGNGEFGSIMHEAAPAYKAGEEKTTANLSPVVRAYLAKLGIKNPDDADTSVLIWMHALAIGYSSAYLTENADGIRQDWPRIPLPDSKTALLASAELGKQVASLLDTENGVEGVTAGKLKPEFKEIAVLSSTKNLSVTVGWGHAGKEGVTMPGKGQLATKILEAAPGYNLPWFEFHDVYLNESACWKDIPAPVWDYTIGGYQVIKKWLSYREHELLCRPARVGRGARSHAHGSPYRRADSAPAGTRQELPSREICHRFVLENYVNTLKSHLRTKIPKNFPCTKPSGCYISRPL
jgi:hypothetical protein